ncbi:MAG: hypothetical protein IJT50_05035 [Lentisphaeria bacterium]|nr:hypothetical protein [Lentisphaeria bacterium]
MNLIITQNAPMMPQQTIPPYLIRGSFLSRIYQISMGNKYTKRSYAEQKQTLIKVKTARKARSASDLFPRKTTPKGSRSASQRKEENSKITGSTGKSRYPSGPKVKIISRPN